MGCKDTLPPNYKLLVVDAVMLLMVFLLWTSVAMALVTLLQNFVAPVIYTFASVILIVTLWPVVVAMMLWWLDLDLTIRCLGLELGTRVSTRSQAHVIPLWDESRSKFTTP